MHALLQQLRDELAATVKDIHERITHDTPLSVNFGIWNSPGLTKYDICRPLEQAISYVDSIDDALEEPDDIDDIKTHLAALIHLRTQTSQHLINGNAGSALCAYQLTAYAICDTLSHLWPQQSQIEKEEITKAIRRDKARVRAIESLLAELEPRTGSIKEMVERIETAHAVADKLPTDLADLAEAKKKITDLLTTAGTENSEREKKAQKHEEVIEGIVSSVNVSAGHVAGQLEKGKGLIEQLVQLHRIGTSTVLAGAFNERAKTLNESVYIWLGVLMVALGGAVYIGHERASIINQLLRDPTTMTSVLVVQSLLMFASMGAPIWLGWVATKQIGQRFKLAEDYHYKASISNAYEGYRREAVDLDDQFRRQLFQSALGRLDEQPLRVMDIDNHGSPAHEIMSRPGFWSFMIHVFGRHDKPQAKQEKAPNNPVADKSDQTD